MKAHARGIFAAVVATLTPQVQAAPTFAGALVIEGSRLDASGGTLVNEGGWPAGDGNTPPTLEPSYASDFGLKAAPRIRLKHGPAKDGCC